MLFIAKISFYYGRFGINLTLVFQDRAIFYEYESA